MKKTYGPRLSWGLICIVMAACGTREAPTSGDERAGEIKTVHNSAGRSIRSGEFDIDLEFGFGTAEMKGALDRPVDLEVDAQGQIYVVDQKAAAVKKFDSQGRFLRQIGGPGQGPGEFESPASIRLGEGDRPYVFDDMRRTILVFDPAGTYARSIRFSNAGFGFDVGGNHEILFHFSDFDPALRKQARRIDHLARFDEQARLLTNIATLERYFYERISAMPFVFKVPAFLVWSVQKSGRIVAGRADRYAFEIYTPDGSLQGKFDKTDPPVPLDPATKKKVREILERLKVEKARTDAYTEHFQYFESIASDEQDRIWVRLYQPDSDGKPAPATVFDVFSPAGEYRYSTTIPRRVKSRILFKAGAVYFLSDDQDGNTGVVRMKARPAKSPEN